MRIVIILFSTIAIGIGGAAIVLPLEYGFVYVGYVGCGVAGVAALYGLAELVRVVAGRPPLLRPAVSALVLAVITGVGALYLHDELLPTRGYCLDGRLMTKLRLVIPDSPSPTPRNSP